MTFWAIGLTKPSWTTLLKTFNSVVWLKQRKNDNFKKILIKLHETECKHFKSIWRLALSGEKRHRSFRKSQNVAGLSWACYMSIVKQIEVTCLWLALAQPYGGINKMAKTKADRTNRQGRLPSGDDHAEGQKKKIKRKRWAEFGEAGRHACKHVASQSLRTPHLGPHTTRLKGGGSCYSSM